MVFMATSATIPVRLSGEIVERLDNYATQLGISRSAAIRLCLAYQLGIIETADPKELPNLDGRTHRYATPEGDQPQGIPPRRGSGNDYDPSEGTPPSRGDAEGADSRESA